jgi:succinate dehydrogenase / fumarate reductase membrane anchor subunit
MSLKTPLARARGHGSAKSGGDHWWAQRITAVALVPLTIWFLWSFASNDFSQYQAAREWFGSLVNAALTMLLVISLGYHAHLGVQVVIEDYVGGAAKIASLIVSQFVLVAAAAIAIISIFRMSLGG